MVGFKKEKGERKRSSKSKQKKERKKDKKTKKRDEKKKRKEGKTPRGMSIHRTPPLPRDAGAQPLGVQKSPLPPKAAIPDVPPTPKPREPAVRGRPKSRKGSPPPMLPDAPNLRFPAPAHVPAEHRSNKNPRDKERKKKRKSRTSQSRSKRSTPLPGDRAIGTPLSPDVPPLPQPKAPKPKPKRERRSARSTTERSQPTQTPNNNRDKKAERPSVKSKEPSASSKTKPRAVEKTYPSAITNLKLNLDEVLRIGSVLERFGSDAQRRQAFEWLAVHRGDSHEDADETAHKLLIAVGDLPMSRELALQTVRLLVDARMITEAEYSTHFSIIERSPADQHITISQLAHLLNVSCSYYKRD